MIINFDSCVYGEQIGIYTINNDEFGEKQVTLNIVDLDRANGVLKQLQLNINILENKQKQKSC